jgi:hypothetical protein
MENRQAKELEKLRVKVLTRAWKDPAFKQKLLKNPKAALKEMGYNVPENVKLQCVENTATNYTLVLPSLPETAREMSDQELMKLAAGAGEWYRAEWR